MPVFLLCCSRTGSTLLRYIIDSHPDVVCPPEFHIVNLAGSLLQGYQIALSPNGFTSEQDLRNATRDNIRTQLDQFMGQVCRSAGKKRWCEKSVYTSDNIQFINWLYPDARYICLYRNCLDQVASGIETLKDYPTGAEYGFKPFLDKTRPNIESGVANYWLEKTSTAFNIEKTFADQVFRIRYEDVVASKDATFAELFSFLGLDWNRSILDTVFNKSHHLGPGDHKIVNTDRIHANSVGRGHEIDLAKLSNEQIRSINNAHIELGYERL